MNALFPINPARSEGFALSTPAGACDKIPAIHQPIAGSGASPVGEPRDMTTDDDKNVMSRDCNCGAVTAGRWEEHLPWCDSMHPEQQCEHLWGTVDVGGPYCQACGTPWAEVLRREGDAAAVLIGEPMNTAEARATITRLVRATAASWTKEREAEARERGYRVTYHKDAYGQTVATFWNGPILCFTREWTP